MDGPIASAVVLPDELIAPASPASHKRRQSSVAEDTAKRPRLDGHVDAQDHHGAVKPAVAVRRERGRERRLFGAALGALSQNPSSAAQKRRSEIEQRQQAQRKHEDEESGQRKAERIARRREQRWREQKRFHLASMRARHDSLRNVAHFLQTETEPRLYYKPWATSPAEDDRIQEQIAQAEDTIRREMEEYEVRQQQGSTEKRQVPADDSKTAQETNGSTRSPTDLDMKDHLANQPGSEAVRTSHTAQDAINSNMASLDPATDLPSTDDTEDDPNGEDVVEEAAEDTVIY
ncbi:hypothetical protein NX059_000239 [Plenodomus lindquistii]|nr:hypothetical protein NX059_000239 [Plenodomus lindquistii]